MTRGQNARAAYLGGVGSAETLAADILEEPKRCRGEECWSQMQSMLGSDLRYLNSAARIDLVGRIMHYVDYSIVFQLSTAYGDHERRPYRRAASKLCFHLLSARV